MNPFYESFPNTVRLDGKDFYIETDFRAVMYILDVLSDPKAGQKKKVNAILGLYKEIPSNVDEAVRVIGDFIVGDREEDCEKEEKKIKKTLSYDKDAPYIAGDFLHFYGIDLTSNEYLHWKKFQLLLTGLPEDSETKTRIAYRLINTSKIKNKEERSRIIRIQKAISIEDTEADVERIGELFGSLA